MNIARRKEYIHNYYQNHKKKINHQKVSRYRKMNRVYKAYLANKRFIRLKKLNNGEQLLRLEKQAKAYQKEHHILEQLVK